MTSIIIFTTIFILAILVCRNNVKNRINELKINLQRFNEEIAKKFNDIPEDKQQEFFNLLDPKLALNLKSILNNNFNYANNHWAIQQQITLQQELFTELHKFMR